MCLNFNRNFEFKPKFKCFQTVIIRKTFLPFLVFTLSIHSINCRLKTHKRIERRYSFLYFCFNQKSKYIKNVKTFHHFS
jgi:hypothetical protein